jgi:hypothetical protein
MIMGMERERGAKRIKRDDGGGWGKRMSVFEDIGKRMSVFEGIGKDKRQWVI